jgi:cation diffusion facilitator CzcD-associated flavoprotein CzcO
MEHVDVLIVGAGLSGVGAASHLKAEAPGKTFAILEARETIGGTWDLFRYPGVRSDSDMFTLGYAFKPWLGEKGIADGASILEYIQETARENGLTERIRFQHKVVSVAWESSTALWTVTAETPAGTTQLTCSFLYANAGYYRYDEGYTPVFEGMERFGGQVIHPQHWPEDLDYEGKRIVVIGSGATAVTLVPALAEKAAHVTMLQRSPTYVGTLPAVDPLAQRLRRRLSTKRAYSAIRWKNILFSQFTYQLSRRRPQVMRKILRKGITEQLPPGYDVATHFNPRYNPWDERLCLSPDGDLFRAIRHGKASVVTDQISTFTATGIRLRSGEELDADIVVTATGLNLLLIGGMTLTVDGREVVAKETLAYKGMMLSGVPNFAFTVGYTNASWTLKADLVASYVARLLGHMDRNGYRVVTPEAPAAAGSTAPLIDLKSGYVLRNVEDLPRQGADAPWRLYQNYPRDVVLFRRGKLEDGHLRFARAQALIA